MIRLEGIEKSFKVGNHELKVLKGIDLHIKEGEMVAIMGSSGSGKSTLLNIIGMLDTHDHGEYLLDDLHIEDLNETKAARYRGKYIGFVFQSFNLVAFKSAMENVALPLYYQSVSRKERNNRALNYLDMVGLKEWANHQPSEMSGGQKQRVAIARALIAEPKIILADEPTGALDSVTSQEVMNLLKKINAEGKTMLVVTHRIGCLRSADRILMLDRGVLVEQGSWNELMALQGAFAKLAQQQEAVVV